MHETKCKRVLGHTICKFKNGNSVFLPISEKHAIPLSIYTAKDCRICKNMIPTVHRLNRSVGRIFAVKNVDVSTAQTSDQVISLPTVMVGDVILRDSDITKEMLIETAHRYFSKR